MVKSPLPVIVFLAMMAGPLHAQMPCLERTIPVNVLTANGQVVPGLSPQNFLGKIRGQEVTILSAASDFGPRRVVMVLDASGSMQKFWDIALLAAKRFISTDQNASLALITFSGEVENRVDFSQGRQRVSDELDALQNLARFSHPDRTALRDAVLAAIDLLKAPKLGDAIFLVTDSRENASNATDPEFTRIALASGVRVFAFVPTQELSDRARTPEAPGGPNWLHGFVTASGGDFASFSPETDTAPDFGPRFSTSLTEAGEEKMGLATVGFANEMTGFYRLTIKLADPLKKPRGWELNVVDANGKTNKQWTIIYPHQLASCSP